MAIACTAAPIDAEIGCLDNASLLSPSEQKFSYARYAMDSPEVGAPMSESDLSLDNIAMMNRLREIGQQYAQKWVRRDHLYSRVVG